MIFSLVSIFDVGEYHENKLINEVIWKVLNISTKIIDRVEIADLYKEAEKITLVMDNLGTHKPGELYETVSTKKTLPDF